MAVRKIPEGYHTVTPYLIVDGAARLLDFVRDAFGAEERFRMAGDDGRVTHAEVRIGDSIIMVSDANDRHPALPAMLHLYVEDCDEMYRRALAAGAESVQEVTTQFYGDRSGGVRDSTGVTWWISTHVEDVSEDEVARRAAAQAS